MNVRLAGVLVHVEVIEAVFVLAAIVLVQAAFGAVALGVGGMFADAFTGLLVDLPDFGGHLYHTYDALRAAVAAPLAVMVILAGLAALKSRAILAVLQRYLVLALALAFFPFLWDAAAAASETAAAWVLNPHFSFDPALPCPEHWSDADIAAARAASPFTQDHTGDNVCRPSLRVEYLAGQLTGFPTYRLPDADNPVGFVLEMLTRAVTGAFVAGLLGVFKAVISVNLMILGLAIGIMADLLAGMVISGMPVFLLLCAVPGFDKTAARLLQVLPPLLVLPVLTAMMVTVGSAAVHSGVGGDAGTLAAWLGSAAALLLAVLVPVMLVPLLGGMAGRAARVLHDGISNAALLAGIAWHLRAKGRP